MSKYIVKNCPAYNVDSEYWDCMHPDTESLSCKDCTDCLIKQVIEKCREVQCPCELEGFDCWECGENRRKTFADTILQLFEIEECEQ